MVRKTMSVLPREMVGEKEEESADDGRKRMASVLSSFSLSRFSDIHVLMSETQS